MQSMVVARKSGVKRLSNEPSAEQASRHNKQHRETARAESRTNHRCRANVQFTKWDNYSTCPSFIQCMIEALKTARKSQLIIFPVSSHGSKWLADHKGIQTNSFPELMDAMLSPEKINWMLFLGRLISPSKPLDIEEELIELISGLVIKSDFRNKKSWMM